MSVLKKMWLLLPFWYVTTNAQTTADTTKAPQYISAIVGFYNLENLFDTVDNPLIQDEEFLPTAVKKYNTTLYNKKLDNMATVISQMGTDVNPDGLALLGVVELENDTALTDLILHDKLSSRGYQYVHFDSKDSRGIDVALVYSPRYFMVLDRKSIPVDLKTGYNTRDILYVKGILAGDTVHIFVNHWPSRRGGVNYADINAKSNAYQNSSRNFVPRDGTVAGGDAGNLRDNVAADGEENTRELRVIAAKACKAVVDSINAAEGNNARVIIMGDLNDDPSNASVVTGIKAKADITKVEPGEIFNPYSDIHKKGYGTLAFNGKWNLFDQIMYAYPFLNQQQVGGWFLFRTHIFRRDYLIEQEGRYKGYPKRTWSGDKFIDGYSDHLPVYTVLLKRID
jgi:hypothetical protein